MISSCSTGGWRGAEHRAGTLKTPSVRLAGHATGACVPALPEQLADRRYSIFQVGFVTRGFGAARRAVPCRDAAGIAFPIRPAASRIREHGERRCPHIENQCGGRQCGRIRRKFGARGINPDARIKTAGIRARRKASVVTRRVDLYKRAHQGPRRVAIPPHPVSRDPIQKARTIDRIHGFPAEYIDGTGEIDSFKSGRSGPE
ncbi:hypothetical protein ACS0X5_28595 [Burkholderia gladioli]|uniref:hypothetical protein n=1 Tax=Burkholderia gladioli TaxID=28095 RepID=UPI003B981CD9